MITHPPTHVRMSQSELVSHLIKSLNSLFERSALSLVYLGGSWSRNQQGWWSDIDIFILWPELTDLDHATQFNKLLDLSVQVEILCNLPSVEVHLLHFLPPHVAFNVVKDGILLHKRSHEEEARYKESLLKIYYDHIIWYKRMLNESLSV